MSFHDGKVDVNKIKISEFLSSKANTDRNIHAINITRFIILIAFLSPKKDYYINIIQKLGSDQINLFLEIIREFIDLEDYNPDDHSQEEEIEDAKDSDTNSFFKEESKQKGNEEESQKEGTDDGLIDMNEDGAISEHLNDVARKEIPVLSTIKEETDDMTKSSEHNRKSSGEGNHDPENQEYVNICDLDGKAINNDNNNCQVLQEPEPENIEKDISKNKNTIDINLDRSERKLVDKKSTNDDKNAFNDDDKDEIRDVVPEVPINTRLKVKTSSGVFGKINNNYQRPTYKRNSLFVTGELEEIQNKIMSKKSKQSIGRESSQGDDFSLISNDEEEDEIDSSK